MSLWGRKRSKSINALVDLSCWNSPSRCLCFQGWYRFLVHPHGSWRRHTPRLPLPVTWVVWHSYLKKLQDTLHTREFMLFIEWSSVPCFSLINIINIHNLEHKEFTEKIYTLYIFTLTFWRRIFFLILAHSVFKMWVIQKPNKVALWNKRHFEENKMEIIQHV